MKALDWCKSLAVTWIIAFGCLTQGAWAATATQLASVINATIDLEARIEGSDVIVTGAIPAVIGTNDYLTLNIDAGVTVVWRATLRGTLNNNLSLINIGGSGTFRMESGLIENIGAGLAITNSSIGFVSIAGGTVSARSLRAINNTSTGTINVSGGTVSATTGIAIYNTSTGTINVSGGTVSTTTGSAIYNASTGRINVSGNAEITSGTTNSGTIFLANSGTATVARLVINGGIVRNTASLGNAIFNVSNGAVDISGGIVSATTGCAIVSIGANNVRPFLTISDNAIITSANDFRYYDLGYPNYDGIVERIGTIQMSYTTLNINGGLVENTLTTSRNGGGIAIHVGDYFIGGSSTPAPRVPTSLINISNGTVKSERTDAIVIGGFLSEHDDLRGAEVNISGGIVLTNGSGDRTAIRKSSNGLFRVTGGTISATQSDSYAINGGPLTLGGDPTIIGRINSVLSVITTGTNMFTPISSKIYTLSSLPSSGIAVENGRDFLSYFEHTNPSVVLVGADVHIAIVRVPTVTFNLNGGTGTAPATIGVALGDDKLHTKPSTTNNITRLGYTNDGNWYTTPAATTEFLFGDNGTPVTANITLYLKWTPIIYTITYNLNGGMNHALNLETYTVVAAVTLQSPTRDGYTFRGWHENADLTGNAVTSIPIGSTGNKTYWARWTAIYTVTYDINGGTGTTPAARTVNAGSSVTLPNVSGFTRDGLTFAGWNTELDGTGTNRNANSSFVPTGNITLYARWTATVIYDINGGTGVTPVEYTVDAGSSLTLASGAELVRNGFNFAGWNTESDGTGINYNASSSFMPSNDITLYARWIPLYTVTFIGWNDEIINEQIVEYGRAAYEPNAPTSVSHNFTGWDVMFDNVEEDLIVTAQWEIKTYTVTFVGWDGEIIDEQVIEYGSTAHEPDAPISVSHNFTGWDVAFDNVTVDLTVTALWEIKTYTVTFIGRDGEIIDEQIIEYGRAAYEPDAPTSVSHDFTGWDVAFDNVTEDLTVTALWEIKTYTVTFVCCANYWDCWDQYVLDEQIVEYGSAAYEPDAPTNVSHNFTGWDVAFDNVTEDLTVTALWEIKTYTVTFIGRDGEVIDEQIIEYGSAVYEPDAPTSVSHNFTGWDVAFDNVTEDLAVTALWEIKTYTVTFVYCTNYWDCWNHYVIDEQIVEHGNAAYEPDVPTNVSHNFTGWDVAFDNVAEDLTVTALWEIKTYTVTFIGRDGEVIDEQIIEYGGTAYEPDAPTSVSHDFTGWDVAFDNVEEDVTVTAQWEIKTYTVTFVYCANYWDCWNHYVIDEQIVEHGSAAYEPDTPTNVSHNFTGWNVAFENVTEDLTITAQWEIKTYTVTFIGWNNEIINEQIVEYGRAAYEPNAPTSVSHNFTGWDVVFDNVTDNLTVLARWDLVSVLSSNRIIPQTKSNTDESKISSVNQLANQFTAGPNPVNRQFGNVTFFRQGKRVQSATLTIFDASGNVVSKIKIKDTNDANNNNTRRIVGSWDLKDAKGRLVGEGTYLVRGVVTASDGKKERVSVMLGIR